ncbi:MAG: Sec-independent protein translocase TatA [Catenulispora sp. 13_1_20CM_3_70_7]|jgi:sec-independent protein translocase protein TatA|nr:MAG: Sec-independent protein translocase TatA [Catenulispora sp. 13_1_20CM_3_70_7]
MGDLQPWHLIVLLVILFLLFGAKRMPDMARSVGQSLRIFKSEMRQGQKETEEVSREAREAARVTPAVETTATTAAAPAADAAQKQANAS